jgi:hypothetical protein
MDLAVLKNQYVADKPAGMPNEWPAEVVELSDGVAFPPDERAGWIVMTQAEYGAHLAANRESYVAWIATQQLPPDIQKIVETKIRSAMDFGSKIIVEYGARNVLSGRTVAEIRSISVKLAEVQTLLMSGSLYCARQAIIDMVPDALVTADDKSEFLWKLNNYLGIPQ